jgi:hypothetical protein
LIPHYKPIESLDAFKSQEVELFSSSPSSSSSSSSSSLAPTSSSSEEQNKNKMTKLDGLSDIIEWKQNHGICFDSNELNLAYSLQQPLRKVVENNSENQQQQPYDRVVFSDQDMMCSSNDLSSIHIFKDMLCEAAVTDTDKFFTKLPQFQAHVAYSSLAYTLQCLEVATREAFQFPKVGQGCDADCLLSYMGWGYGYVTYIYIFQHICCNKVLVYFYYCHI